VINLAALVGEPLCSKYPAEAERTNTMGTRLADLWCHEHKARLIHVSTCSNYGVSEGVADEETDVKPLGVYAGSKVFSEEEAKKAGDYTVFRFGTLYGVSPRMRWDIMINEWVYDCLRNGELEVYNGLAYRPFLHIQDACRAIKFALGMPDATRGQTFNVAGINITKEQLAGAVVGAVGGGWRLVSGSDKRDYRVSSEKFTKATGFSYQHIIENLWADIQELRRFALVRKTSNVEDFVMPND
jgi:nucleoside-diphosphate-sugar epimerase